MKLVIGIKIFKNNVLKDFNYLIFFCFREKDNHIEDLLEKQADLLRYLREQNTRLIQKVLILSTQLKEKHGSQIT